MKEGSPTQKAFRVPRVAVFVAGIAAGTFTLLRRPAAQANAEALRELRNAAADLETRVAAQELASAQRFAQIESRLEEHAAKLAEVPSTNQIVAAMEQILVKTMAGLENRLTTQARAIDALKSTVSQTDSVLERILESLDMLQTDSDAPEPTEEDLLKLTA